MNSSLIGSKIWDWSSGVVIPINFSLSRSFWRPLFAPCAIVATGASFGLCQLYTDADEMLFQAARPILLNGIDDVIGRSDLADRALFLTLQPIADRRRRVERQLWREFEVARPRILGSLLDAAAHGLRNVAGIHLEEASF